MVISCQTSGFHLITGISYSFLQFVNIASLHKVVDPIGRIERRLVSQLQ